METPLTVREAAEILGYHPDHLRRLLRAGIVKGRQFSQVWLNDSPFRIPERSKRRTWTALYANRAAACSTVNGLSLPCKRSITVRYTRVPRSLPNSGSAVCKSARSGSPLRLALGERQREQMPHAILLDDPVTANARGLARLAQRPGLF